MVKFLKLQKTEKKRVYPKFKSEKSLLLAYAKAWSKNDYDLMYHLLTEETRDEWTFSKLMELAYPTKIIKVGKRNVTVNLPEERAKKGQLWHVFEVGETILDPDTGESLGADEELLGDIRIYRVGPKFAKAKPIGDLEIDDIEEGMIIRPVSDEEMEERQAEVKKQSVKRFRRRF